MSIKPLDSVLADASGDFRLGLEWIGDRDLSQAKAYMKRRAERMEEAADAAVDRKPFPNRSSARKMETAPVSADAANHNKDNDL